MESQIFRNTSIKKAKTHIILLSKIDCEVKKMVLKNCLSATIEAGDYYVRI